MVLFMTTNNDKQLKIIMRMSFSVMTTHGEKNNEIQAVVDYSKECCRTKKYVL